MITAIRLELMKWKRSKILFLAFIAILISPAITLVSASLKANNLGVQVKWVDIIALSMQVNHLFVFPLTFSALAAFIFVQEYQTGAVINLYTLPVRRSTIILAKTVTLFITLAALTILSHVVIILTGTIFLNHPWAAFVQYFPLAVKAGMMQFLLMPIFICAGVWTRHFIPPLIAAGAVIMIDFISLAMPTIGPLLFPAIPYYVILAGVGWYPTGIRSMPFTWELLVPTFFIFLIVALISSEKADIH